MDSNLASTPCRTPQNGITKRMESRIEPGIQHSQRAFCISIHYLFIKRFVDTIRKGCSKKTLVRSRKSTMDAPGFRYPKLRFYISKSQLILRIRPQSQSGAGPACLQPMAVKIHSKRVRGETAVTANL